MERLSGIALRCSAWSPSNTHGLPPEQFPPETKRRGAGRAGRAERRSPPAWRRGHGRRLGRQSQTGRDGGPRRGISRRGGHHSFFGSRRSSREKERYRHQERGTVLQTHHQASIRRWPCRASRVDRYKGRSDHVSKAVVLMRYASRLGIEHSSTRLRRQINEFHQRLGIGIELAFAGPMPPAGRVAPCAASRKFTTAQ